MIKYNPSLISPTRFSLPIWRQTLLYAGLLLALIAFGCSDIEKVERKDEKELIVVRTEKYRRIWAGCMKGRKYEVR